MKKIFALVLISVMGLPAFAQSQISRNEPRQSVRHEDQQFNDGQFNSKIGRVIGGIIRGVVESGALDNDHSRRGYRGQVTCYAENRRGDRFKARGNRPRFVQDEAIRRCYNYGSRQCYAAGCRTDRWD